MLDNIMELYSTQTTLKLFLLMLLISTPYLSTLVAQQVLKRARAIHGISIPKGSVIFKKKNYQRIRLSQTTPVKNFLAAGKTNLYLYNNGKLKGFTTAQKVKIAKFNFFPYEQIRFDSKGKLQRAFLNQTRDYASITLHPQPKNIKSKQWLHFYPSGAVKTFPVYFAIRSNDFLLGKDYASLLHKNGALYRFTLKKEQTYQGVFLRRNTHIFLLPDGKYHWQVLAKQNQTMFWNLKESKSISTEPETYSDKNQPNAVFLVKKFHFRLQKTFQYQKKKFLVKLNWSRSLEQKGNRIQCTVQKGKKDLYQTGSIHYPHKKSEIRLDTTLKHKIPHKETIRLQLKLKISSRMNRDTISYQISLFDRKGVGN